MKIRKTSAFLSCAKSESIDGLSASDFDPENAAVTRRAWRRYVPVTGAGVMRWSSPSAARLTDRSPRSKMNNTIVTTAKPMSARRSSELPSAVTIRWSADRSPR